MNVWILQKIGGLEVWILERWKVEGVKVSGSRLSWISCCEVNLPLIVPHQLLQPQDVGVEHTGHPVHLLARLLLLQGLVNKNTSRLAGKNGHL